MALTAAIVATLAAQCAAAVSPQTLVSLVRVESAFDPLAISVNGLSPARLHPRSLPDAVAQATLLLASGASVDLGLGQINSANLTRLGLSIGEAFEPCRSLHAAGQVLEEAYDSQVPRPGQEQAALRRALSIYNTGRPDRGFRNGYVAKVTAAARVTVPALASEASGSPQSPPPAWDVFAVARASGARLVFTSAGPGGVR